MITLDEFVIEYILRVLSDERVSNKLYDIINKNLKVEKSQFNFLNGEQQLLYKKENNDSLKGENDLLKKENDSLRGENDLLKKENDSLKEFYNIIDEPLHMYEVYRNLPEKLKNTNLEFISENSLFAFILTGVINLERFWNFIKEELLGNRMEYIDQFKIIFEFFFDMKNGIKQLYVRNKCDIGDIYNYNKHIMMPGGQNLGVVSEILFLGFSDNNGKIIRKTVVRVENI